MNFKKEQKERKHDNVTDMLEYKYKIEGKKKRKRHLIVLAVIIVILLLAFLFKDKLTLQNAQIFMNHITAAVKGEDINTLKFSYDTKNQYSFYKDRLVVASTDGIRMYQPGNTESTFIPLSYGNMKIDVNDKFILAYNSTKNNCSIIAGSSVLGTHKMNGSISSARLGKGGSYSIVTEESGYKSVIHVYNKEMQEIYRYYYAKNLVMDSHTSPNNKKMAAIYLDSQSSKLTGGVAFFDFGKDEPVAHHNFEGEMPLALNYKDSNMISVVHTGGIATFHSDGKLVGEYPFHGLVPYTAALSASGYTSVLLGTDSVTDIGTLHIVSNSGKLVATYQPPGKVKKLLSTNSAIVVYVEDKVIILGFDGKEKKTIELERTIRDVTLTDTNDLYLIGIGAAQRIGI